MFHRSLDRSKSDRTRSKIVPAARSISTDSYRRDFRPPREVSGECEFRCDLYSEEYDCWFGSYLFSIFFACFCQLRQRQRQLLLLLLLLRTKQNPTMNQELQHWLGLPLSGVRRSYASVPYAWIRSRLTDYLILSREVCILMLTQILAYIPSNRKPRSVFCLRKLHRNYRAISLTCDVSYFPPLFSSLNWSIFILLFCAEILISGASATSDS